MKKTLLLLSIACLLVVSPAGWGSPKTFSEIRRDNSEMRKNITWLLEGLLELGTKKDPKLVLTLKQKQAILPVFQALVENKIIILKNDPPQNSGNNNNQRQERPDPNDPAWKERIKKTEDQTAFGNGQSDKIDQILTKAQLELIDNLEFNAEKYGYVDFTKYFSGGQTGQRPDPKVAGEIRGKMKAGREEQVKLNNNVLAMLTKNK